MRVWKAHMEFRSVLISRPYCFLREALSLGSELTNSARLASQWALRSACFLPQPWDYTPGHHGFLHRCWESNVGPHAYTASFLPTPQVLALDLNSLIQSSILNLIAGNTPLAEKKGKTTTKKAFEKCVCLTWQERNTTPMQQYPFPQLVGRRNFYTIFLIRFSFSMLAPFSQTFGWGISCLVEWPKGLSLHDFHIEVFITRHSGTPRAPLISMTLLSIVFLIGEVSLTPECSLQFFMKSEEATLTSWWWLLPSPS